MGASASDLESLQSTSSELLTLVLNNENSVSQLLDKTSETCEAAAKDITQTIEGAGKLLQPQLQNKVFIDHIKNAFDDIYIQMSSVGFTPSAPPVSEAGDGSFNMNTLRAQNIVVTDKIEVKDSVVMGTLKSSPRPAGYWELGPNGVSKANILSVGTKGFADTTSYEGYCITQTIKPFSTLLTGNSEVDPRVMSTCSNIGGKYRSFTIDAEPGAGCSSTCDDDYCKYMITPINS